MKELYLKEMNNKEYVNTISPLLNYISIDYIMKENLIDIITPILESIITEINRNIKNYEFYYDTESEFKIMHTINIKELSNRIKSDVLVVLNVSYYNN